MTSNEFVDKLGSLSPTKESFIKLGYSLELVDKRMREYKCLNKETTKQLFIKDELLLLLESYDCSNVHIGIISFVKELQEKESIYFIGYAEADILSVNKITGEVEVLDHDNIDWVIWSCAANGDSFLDAMICASDFFSRRISNRELLNDIKYTFDAVLRCTAKAGGEKYIDFYKVLLGYDY